MQQETRVWGYARAPVHTATDEGHRFVIAHNSIYITPAHFTFHDFLLDYLRRRLDGPWVEREQVKGEGERHPLLDWFAALNAMKGEAKAANPSAILRQTIAPPNVYDMLRTAFDLFIVHDSGRLEESLVKRLTANQEFGGARYELAVAACFIRAGFKLTLIDPSKGKGRPCEFVAESRDGSEVYSVEAKSRQRPGIFGFPGVKGDPAQLRLDVGRLVRAALSKDADHDRVICIDISLPAAPQGSIPKWIHELDQMVKELAREEGPPAYILSTNSPNRYLPDEAVPVADAVGLVSHKMPAAGADILIARPALSRVVQAWAEGDRVPSRW